MAHQHLITYLNDHLAGSVAGVELAERCLADETGTPLGAFLAGLVPEIERDRQELKELIGRLDGGENALKKAAGWLAEKVGEVKLGDRFSADPDLSRLERLEVLLLGVRGKLALWRALEALEPADARFLGGIDLAELSSRAEGQLAGLERHRLEAARRAFASGGATG